MIGSSENEHLNECPLGEFEERDIVFAVASFGECEVSRIRAEREWAATGGTVRSFGGTGYWLRVLDVGHTLVHQGPDCDSQLYMRNAKKRRNAKNKK